MTARKPGRKLDALVAEKCMGWSIPRMLGKEMPYWSTDIAAAWPLAVKYQMNIEWAGDLGWQVRTFDQGSSDWCLASTAPHAICLAALAAEGVT